MSKNFGYIILVLSIHFSGSAAFSQVRKKYDFSHAPSEIRSLVASTDHCINSSGENCTGYLLSAISKAGHDINNTTLGSLYAKLLHTYFLYGQHDSILHYGSQALHVAMQRKEWYNIGAINNLIGAAYIEYGENTDSALHYFLKARPYFARIGDNSRLAENYSNIAGVYVDIADNIHALKNYKTGFRIAVHDHDEEYAGIVAANISQCYLRMDSLAQAKHWCLLGVRYIEKANNKDDLITGYTFLSNVYRKCTDLDSALYYSRKAMALAEQRPDKMSLARTYTSYARILVEQKRYKEAWTFVQKSIAIHEPANNIKALTRDYYTAAEIAVGLSDYKTAVEYYDKNYTLLYQSVSEDNIEAIKMAKEKYETEKKERLIAEKELVIEKKNAQMRLWLTGGLLLALGGGVSMMQYRKAQKTKLSQAEQEKENAILKAWMNGEERERNRISQELHDGVAAMIGAARMNLQAVPHMPEEKQDAQLQKVSSILENTHGDVRRIAHNLLPVTLQKEGLVNAVQQFAADISDTGILQVQVENHFTHLHLLSPQIQLMLFRIIQELLNNTIKHSSATVAIVHFTGTQQELQIEVKDNGRGFASGHEEKGQGLYSIRQRLHALGGAFDIDSEEGKGTVASLKILLSKG